MTTKQQLELTDEGLEMPEWLQGRETQYTVHEGHASIQLTPAKPIPEYLPTLDVYPEGGTHVAEDGEFAFKDGDGDWRVYEVVDRREEVSA